MKNKIIISIAVLLLILITLATSYYGSIDIGDYSDTAKYFAGEYSAKIRSSHSYLFGFLHAPLLLAKSFIGFKIISLILLFLIIYSVYKISNKNQKAFLLVLFSPIIWYMAPWINPIQLASLILLWAYYFINKYEEADKLKYLIYSGILIGVGWAFWNTLLYFGLFLAIAFLYNKKTIHAFYFAFFVFIGLIPRLILDQLLFNFAFYTVVKTTLSNLLATFLGGIYSDAGTSYKLISFLLVFLAIPIYFWRFYSKKLFKKNKKTMIFLTLSILLILSNPQIRYTLTIVPVIILIMVQKLDKLQFKKQLIISAVILLLFINPYIIQISHNINGKTFGIETTEFLRNINNLKFSPEFPSDLLEQDLAQISKDYPNQTFVVGNAPDEYQALAHFYWGANIKEFVSIQDYELFLKNESILFEKTFMPQPNINCRRQFWIAGGLKKNENDNTDYEGITLAIGVREPIELDGFNLSKNYTILYLSEKK